MKQKLLEETKIVGVCQRKVRYLLERADISDRDTNGRSSVVKIIIIDALRAFLAPFNEGRTAMALGQTL